MYGCIWFSEPKLMLICKSTWDIPLCSHKHTHTEVRVKLEVWPQGQAIDPVSSEHFWGIKGIAWDPSGDVTVQKTLRWHMARSAALQRCCGSNPGLHTCKASALAISYIPPLLYFTFNATAFLFMHCECYRGVWRDMHRVNQNVHPILHTVLI